MKLQRLRLAVVSAWMLGLGCPELLPASLAARVASAAVVLLLVCWPRAERWSWWQASLPAAAGAILAKLLLGQQPVPHLAQTLIDAAVIVASAVLGLAAARGLREFSDAVRRVALARLPGQHARRGGFYREVRRARRTGQPLALLALAPGSRETAEPQNRLVEETLRAFSGRYTLGRIAQLLCDEVPDCDLFWETDGRLVALLPIADRGEADRIVGRLRDAARRSLGLELAVGQAEFPAEEVTLVGLLQHAILEMHEARDGAAPATRIAGLSRRPAPAGEP